METKKEKIKKRISELEHDLKNTVATISEEENWAQELHDLKKELEELK